MIIGLAEPGAEYAATRDIMLPGSLTLLASDSSRCQRRGLNPLVILRESPWRRRSACYPDAFETSAQSRCGDSDFFRIIGRNSGGPTNWICLLASTSLSWVASASGHNDRKTSSVNWYNPNFHRLRIGIGQSGRKEIELSVCIVKPPVSEQKH